MNEKDELEGSDLSSSALRIFTRVADAWSLTESERNSILGQPVEVAFGQASAQVGGTASLETLQRVGYLIGIYSALHTIFSNQEQANGWVRRPNKADLFRGTSALEFMCSGSLSGLSSVQQYLYVKGQIDR